MDGHAVFNHPKITRKNNLPQPGMAKINLGSAGAVALGGRKGKGVLECMVEHGIQVEHGIEHGVERSIKHGVERFIEHDIEHGIENDMKHMQSTWHRAYGMEHGIEHGVIM